MDIIVTYFDKLVSFMKKNRRLIFRVFPLAFLLLFFSFLFKTYAVITVTVAHPSSIKDSEIISYSNNDLDSIKIGTTGLMIVPREIKSITVSAGSYIKSQKPVYIPWYGYDEVEVSLKTDVNADKVAYNTMNEQPCATYNRSSDMLLSYNCAQPSSLNRYNTPGDNYWINTIVNSTNYADKTAAPYRGGIIGINKSYDAQKALTFYDGNSGSIDYNAPSSVDMSTFTKSIIVTNTSNPEDRQFLIITPSGDIYTASPPEDNKKPVKYVKFSAPSDYNQTYQHTLCSISGVKIYCYRGYAKVGDYQPPSNAALPSIFSAQFGDTTAKSINVTDKYMDSIYSDRDGNIYGLNYTKLYRFTKSEKGFESREIAQNVESAMSGNDLYTVQKSGVYKVNSDTSTQIFYSENILPKSVYIYGDRVYFLGSVSDRPDTTFGYLLNQSSNTTPGLRLIDLYPTNPSKFNGLMTQDLVGENLYGTLYQIGNMENNAPSLSADVLLKMQSLGIDVSKYSVRLVY